MTLDEAIKHEEEVAEDYQRCAEEHQQLAEWLTDYKRLLEQEPCEDAISRQVAIDNIMGEPTDAHYPSWYADKIAALPSVTPKQRTGRWIRHNYVSKMNQPYSEFECDNCHRRYSIMLEYCPHCGTKMVAPQESEDKE